MNRYHARLKRLIADSSHPKQPSKPSKLGFEGFEGGLSSHFLKNEAKRSYRAAFDALERRCPDYVEDRRWQQAVADGYRFLVQWGQKAATLGWSARDLFGLAAVPDRPAPNYRRLSRYDQTGLIWLLQGRPVMALTDAAATIESPSGAITIYRRHNKLAPGHRGDGRTVVSTVNE
jgi:hypothetical protein